MASTYVNNLRLEEMATGEKSGTWGTITNTNLELVGEAFGYGTEALATDANATITMTDGTSDGIRSFYVKITSGVDLTATRTVTIAPDTVSKMWFIENATSGSQSITISQGSGTTVTIPTGEAKIIYTDGGGASANVVDAVANVEYLKYNYVTTLGTSEASKVVTADSDNRITVGGSAVGTVTAVTSSSNITDFDMNTSNDFTHSTSENTTFTFSNEATGQSGNIFLDNTGTAYTISLGADVWMSATDLTAISSLGVYLLSYFSPDGTNVYMSTTGALTEGT
jgi:hypothetical protein